MKTQAEVISKFEFSARTLRIVPECEHLQGFIAALKWVLGIEEPLDDYN
jgi:hypothetical protein